MGPRCVPANRLNNPVRGSCGEVSTQRKASGEARVVAIVQARMGSTRLPGKVLKPLRGRPALEHVLRRLRAAALLADTVVATTELEEDRAIALVAEPLGVRVVRGPVDDVLTRYQLAATLAGAEHVVRITADCPCIDPRIVDRVVRAHLESGADYTSNIHPRTFPHGLDVEVVKTSALFYAAEHAGRREEREHVTPYIWTRPERFRLQNVFAEPGEKNPQIRVTLDTPEDYLALQAVFDLAGSEDFGARELVALFQRYPWLSALNAVTRQKLPPVPAPPAQRALRELVMAAGWALEQELSWAAAALLRIGEQVDSFVSNEPVSVEDLRGRLRLLETRIAQAGGREGTS